MELPLVPPISKYKIFQSSGTDFEKPFYKSYENYLPPYVEL